MVSDRTVGPPPPSGGSRIGGRRPRLSRTPGLVVGVCALLLATTFTVDGTAPGPSLPSVLKQFNSHVSHVVFVILENHAYDNYFGTYCQSLSKYCRSVGNGIPAGTCVARYPGSPSVGCIRPFDFTPGQLAPPDLNHDWNSTHGAINGGSMNGFFVSEGSTPEPFGHYNGTTIPTYWDLAEQYGLADTFYSSAATYSLPNHWFAVAAAAPAISEHNYPAAGTIQVRHTYLNQSNATPSVEDALINSTTVSWNYYDWALPPYSKAITNGATPANAGLAYDLWAPLAGRGQSYQATVRSHFVPSSQFPGDAQNGTLPNISWVIPPALYSDHPPYNVSAGQTWVASLVDSVEASPEWNSTVMFVTWDEYGGFYDHVKPPIIDANGEGIRVPLLAIGPYVKQGFIDHDAMDFDSILHLMEKRFGLPCTGPRDCNATLPLAMFNFNRTARSPIFIPPYANASYPMPLQSSGKLPVFSPFGIPRLPYPSSGAAPDPGLFADGGLG